jgi:imidazolonepropionase-like amidohydrolase
MDWIWRWSEDPQTLELAYELAQRAIGLEDSLPMAHRALGGVYLWYQQHDQAIAEADGRVVAGSATRNPYVIPGASLHRELELLVQAGLTPMQALRAATQVAAKLLGQEARLGTLAEGKVADFVILDGNPLADIRQIRQVEVVLQEGQIVWKK